MKTRAILSQLRTSWGYFIWNASMVQRRSVCSTRAVVEVLECVNNTHGPVPTTEFTNA